MPEERLFDSTRDYIEFSQAMIAGDVEQLKNYKTEEDKLGAEMIEKFNPAFKKILEAKEELITAIYPKEGAVDNDLFLKGACDNTELVVFESSGTFVSRLFNPLYQAEIMFMCRKTKHEPAYTRLKLSAYKGKKSEFNEMIEEVTNTLEKEKPGAVLTPRETCSIPRCG